MPAFPRTKIMTSLVEKILALSEALNNSEFDYAFGGALALAFHVEEPRGTRDIDVNIFASVGDGERVCQVLPQAIVCAPADLVELQRSGQVRLFWGDTPIDIFLSTTEFHRVVLANLASGLLGNIEIPILGATELAVFKAFFNRTKDWADIEAMVECNSVQIVDVVDWITRLFGAHDERIERLRKLEVRR